MTRKFVKFVLIFTLVLALDQFIKFIFLNGFSWEGEYFSLILTFNRGVAFSMLAFLGESLKFIQLGLIALLAWYVFSQKELFNAHWLPFGILLGGGVSNVLDRFIHGGVVDYVAWHKWFEFAVFNFADVMIDLAIVIFLWQNLKISKKGKI
ncbi:MULTISPECIES: signal peptidase II [unclassified Campylobacter]|uniref:signal peptidase II n=1 Tax=unclassified Campylobacter TaxID=2593542 RepID=UPI0022E9D9F8|nr:MULTISPECIES: signal peptidase II [unclassified Campylobacter]MDA3054682.1 signal peptidase II [Campylobacter sp. VBCF_07 NA4]MDA3062932.1 signal peptidase II [Campylobacter sp. JMF_14 EL1]MDA3070632.1 signal peptidase II [Campylobacter sp. VBCF_08 NA3]MDA3074087.1 signal peptidase II [Campylobacter sp. JMF_10 EL2]MDA3077032.1 signal peptidase II [Campylobacter sp. JMF_04 NA10]